MMNKTPVCLTLFFSFFSLHSNAQQFAFSSPATQVQLVELYTSQGCSSCPPAERKLSQLVNSEQLWNEIVPVAFHVDYWNYLGWKDIYSSAENTKRQQRHYSLGNISSIYTPGFVINGSEWRGYFRGQKIPLAKQRKVGKLNLHWDSTSESVNMHLQNMTSAQPHRCYFSLLSFATVNVQAGENKGLKLKQDFSAITLQSAKVIESKNDFSCSATLQNLDKLALAKKTDKLALVGWVTSAREEPIQAVGGWL